MSFGSDNDFPPLADFALNQILGYQDVNDIKSMPNRLRDAFQRQHAWDDNTVGDIPWNIAWPNWDLGDHVGNIGVPLHTTFFGDGSNLTGVENPQTYRNRPLRFEGTQNARIFGAFTNQYVYVDVPIYDISQRCYLRHGRNDIRTSILPIAGAAATFRFWDRFVFLCGGTQGSGSYALFEECFIDHIAVYYNSVLSQWEVNFFGYLSVKLYDVDSTSASFSTSSGLGHSITGPGVSWSWSEDNVYILNIIETGARYQIMKGDCGWGGGFVNGRLYVVGNILRMDLQFHAAGTNGGWGNSGYNISGSVYTN